MLRRIFKYSFPFLAGILFFPFAKDAVETTSTDAYCQSCHVHPQAAISWKKGPHFDTRSGTVTHCVDCHLPPEGFAYFSEKIKTGTRDLISYWLKDPSEFNWELASTREVAMKHVYKASCQHCHQNLFSKGLSEKGRDAHLHYSRKENELRCLNCHLEAGHYHEPKNSVTEIDVDLNSEIFSRATYVDSFQSFTEKIPGTKVTFNMIAIPGGVFTIGSPENESGRNRDEGPQRRVRVDSIWMGEVEVSWQEFDTYYRATARAGRTEDQIAADGKPVDAISGPTPAYGDPSQGWGRGKRPAITMTFYAAQQYCRWLSEKTGKHYRLPTEAEWEYACRAGTENPYFFPGQPDEFGNKHWLARIFGSDTTINSYVIYENNSRGRTSDGQHVKSNAFGLKNMLGNVKEFCSDWYEADIYANYSADAITQNPSGPKSGDEHVVRGGSYKSSAKDVRAATREKTNTVSWMRTDPQLPKSLWWYSDNAEVGFRVVCEYDAGQITKRSTK
ncbi:MAG: SUMF1/EgtB/PvdO family nonheme iron enzyme [Deferribacteres bacterium]|nr:SUMF1/EgtB/PvdO family nonheme iron enzyme [candidate division KSB1 bacterium]MCB9501151.1 SUMF1/EgtB/PvdO family nonheme iron enzyme [Deferribacteres bacterium]